MSKTINGKALKYGDNINTDIISPPQYMEQSIEEASKYAMSGVDPDFYKKVKTNKIFVAGNNLGSGSSRETSPLTLKYLGVKAVIAVFFARIFYRNCINIGLPAIECSDAGKIEWDDELIIDYREGIITNVTRNEKYKCSKIPDHILELIEDDGLVSYMKKKERRV